MTPIRLDATCPADVERDLQRGGTSTILGDDEVCSDGDEPDALLF